ncbi:MFS transporter [Bacillus wiedmannii]|uniref:MFS transporter n=1 Tax=Bacillus wiedmannii TaxID=1890302 RepID=UPI0006DAA3B1|nr:MFS transporter [Bacillus wiedmannii]KPU56628.1 sugar (and other) transporter family protein [Bacillus wiedmannii]
MNIGAFKKLHINVKIRLIEQFASSLTGNMVFPFMIIYFSQVFGERITGIIFIINVIISFISGIYGGHFADKIGRKKIMVYAEVFRFVALLIMAAASSDQINSPILIFIMNIIVSACTGFSRPAGEAMLIDSSPVNDRKFVYTVDYVLWNTSLLIGGLVGGFFFKEYRFELILSLSLISLGSLILLLTLIKETYVPSKKVHQETSKKESNKFLEIINNYKVVIKNKTFKIFLFASLLELSVQLQAMNYTGVRLVKELDKEIIQIANISINIDGYKMYGFLNFTNTVFVLLLAYTISKYSKKFKEKNILFMGIVLYSIGFSLISFLNIPTLLIASMLIVVIGELLYVPIKQSLLAELVPEDNRGSYMAINGLTSKGATILGSMAVTLGSFIPSIGMAILFLAIGLVSILLYRNVFQLKESTAQKDNRKIVG